MQIEVKLRCLDDDPISFDYLYSLHSAITTCLVSSHSALARDLHDEIHKDRAKLICFSPFHGGKAVTINFAKHKQLQLGRYVWFRIASPIPEFLNAIGESLLLQRKLQVMGKEFSVQTINMLVPPVFKKEMVWRPFGCSASVVTTWTPEGGEERFIRPGKIRNGEPAVEQILKNNLFTKFNKRLSMIREDIAQAWLTDSERFIRPGENQNGEPPVEETLKTDLSTKFNKRLSIIRKDIAQVWLTDSESNAIIREEAPLQIDLLPVKGEVPFKKISTKNNTTEIYSWRCPVKVKAPIALQRTLWSCGLGSMNFQGFGLMQEGQDDS